MINSQYSSVITSAGHTVNIQSKALGTTIIFDEIAFGSGGLVPSENATGLIKEEVRTKIHSIVQNQSDTNILEIEAVIPAHIGGFTINEAALYLDDGTLYAVASLPESYKPVLDQGAGKEFLFVFFLTSVGVENVALTIDGGASFVTTNYFQNELKKYAFITGDETKKFKVADAEYEKDAVNKKQIDELESRLNDSIETINDSIETINDSIGTLNDSVSKNTTTATTTTGTKVVGAGYMGEFENGLWRIFQQSGTFVVPTGVTSIRVRVVGAGGGSGGSPNGGGGGGGGYAHGIFNVIAGDSYTVTVGTGGAGAGAAAGIAGGTSSFGLLISATGGAGGASYDGGIGGQGVGGDFQSKGGSSLPLARSAGGGAGSQLGDGGTGGGTGGGGGGTGGAGGASGGGSAFGNAINNFPAPDITGASVGSGMAGALNPINATIRFPFDSFTGGGGGTGATGGTGGIGGGGGAGATGGTGGIGGGGGCATTVGGVGGNGGIGGGGGAAAGTATCGNGGNGLVVVEW